MRITNRIMQRNNLSNINTNKIYQDRLSTQMSSQKKISRPSEDPVVAIRALRLRSNVTEITQYYTKNIPDAESWLKLTEDSLSNLTQVITNMKARCDKGANNYLETSDRKIILEEMKNLGKEVYSTGNADYAGRYIFTGFRTDTSLSFLSARTQHYSITEQLSKDDLSSVMKVETGKLLDINSANYDTLVNDNGDKLSEDDISSVEVNRIRLAYNDCSDYDGAATSPVIEFTDANGNPVKWSGFSTGTPAGDFTLMHSYDTNPNPYKYAADNDDALVYIPETGEILLGKNKYAQLMDTKDKENTPDVNEGEIRVTYEKSNWQKDDLRPEHYFYCNAEKVDDAGNVVKDENGNPVRIEYNDTYLTANAERQAIEYDVGFNQTIRINSTADECFQHGIGREVDDIVNAMQDVLDLEGVQASIESIMKGLPDDDPKQEILQDQLDAVGKALTYAKEKEQKLFERGLTVFDKYLDAASVCVTECGSRGSKLDLIKNRSQNQKTTYETLKSENEDIDITEVAIHLSSAELTYDAALMAAGKVMQTTLLNFI